MAFDAGILRMVCNEVTACKESKIEKIYQPSNDEIVILLHSQTKGSVKLLINAGSNYPRINLTDTQSENPIKAPMFCMLLRKHLSGGKMLSCKTVGFERVCKIEFEAYDEMGFKSKKYLICEIMGKYSNIILTDSNDKIIAILKSIDFSTSRERQLLCGMNYTMPPAQNKLNTLEIGKEDFMLAYKNANGKMKCEKFLSSSFLGIASSTAREITFLVCRDIDKILEDVDEKQLCEAFFKWRDKIKSYEAEPYIIHNENGAPQEFSYMPLTYFGNKFKNVKENSFSKAIDLFYETKDRNEKIRQKSTDIFRLLTNAENRITKKISLQSEELKECDQAEEYKLEADLIISNIHLIKKGDMRVKAVNYYGNMEDVEIELDTRLNPSQNAQRYYKKYNKLKKAKTELAKQIELAKQELEYIYTVFDSLSKAETESDLSQIREELYHSGYASRMKNYSSVKMQTPKPLKLITSGGYTLFCGKNNTQNDYVTTKLAEKGDWWFHTKNIPGSHVVMQCNGEEPSEKDFTEAAEVAAFYSKAEGNNIAVDYTKAKNVKKPAGAKPGFVIYSANWTAYVTPDEGKIKSMLKK